MVRLARLLCACLLLLLLPALALAQPAPAPRHWQRISAQPRTADVLGIAYADGLFVTVGKWGTVASSADGATWTEHATPTDHHLTAVAYGNGLWVAVGEDGAGLTSTDGRTWQLHATGLTGQVTDMVWANGRFIAVGLGGLVALSKDGAAWVTVDAGTGVNLRAIAYGDGRVVAVGDCGTVLTGTDGTLWQQQTSGSRSNLQDVAWGDGRFLAVGDPGAALTSTDGVRWVGRSGITAQIPVWRNGAGRVVAEDVGRKSPDEHRPRDWQPGFEERAVKFYRVVYGPRGFVVADNAKFFTSTDLLTWTPHYPQGGDVSWPYLAAGGGRYVAAGWFGQTAVSTTGTAWAVPVRPFSPWLQKAAYGNGRYVAVGQEGGERAFLMSSADGRQWQMQTIDRLWWLRDVTHGDGRFVAVGDGIATSADGVEWTVPVWPSGDPRMDWYGGVAYGNGLFVAVGNTGAVLVSTDGLTWGRHENWQMSGFQGLVFGNGQFVAYGHPDRLMLSRDGITWEEKPLPLGYWVDSAAFGVGRFVFKAVDHSGWPVLVSTADFVSYQETGADRSWWVDNVAYGDGLFLAGGDFNAVPVSTHGIGWQPTPYRGEQMSLMVRGGGRTLGLTRQGAVWLGSEAPRADAVISDVQVNRPLVPADGQQQAIITVTLRDRNGAPVSGMPVVLEGGTDHTRIRALQSVSGADGVIRFLVANGRPERLTFGILVGEERMTLPRTATVSFGP